MGKPNINSHARFVQNPARRPGSHPKRAPAHAVKMESKKKGRNKRVLTTTSKVLRMPAERTEAATSQKGRDWARDFSVARFMVRRGCMIRARGASLLHEAWHDIIRQLPW